MLVNLHTVYRPENITEAAARLRQPDAYPIYGGGASLLRAPDDERRDVESAVDLAAVVSAGCRAEADGDLVLGSAATLSAIAAADSRLRPYIEADAPLTLRNTLTLGDLLMEARPDSLFLALLFGLVARIDTPEHGRDDLIEIGRWFDMSPGERRHHLALGVVIPRFEGTLWRFAFSRVSRTPADAPIVAAIAFVYAGTPDPGSYVVVCGLDHRPVRYSAGMASRIDDYKGSAGYRAAMAQLLGAQALESARATLRA